MQALDPMYVRGAADLILLALFFCVLMMIGSHLPDDKKPPRNKRLEEYLKNKHKPEE